MVKTGLRFFSLLCLALLLPVLPLPAKPLADYQLGDIADEDIVATTRLTVVDPDGTEALRQKEAQRVPVVIRCYTNVADEVADRFRAAFITTQDNFLETVYQSFGRRKLSVNDLAWSKFYLLAISFQKQNKLFPLTTSRATLWASGDADVAYEASLANTLRQAMARPIRPEPLPDGIKLGNTERVVPLADTNAVLTSQAVDQLGKNMPRSNLLSLAQVKKNFQTNFGPDERDVAKYLATFLELNCVVDQDITKQLRAKRTEDIWAVDNYDTGQIIAHRGQVIDKKIKAALDQLKDKVVVGQLQELQVKQQTAVGQLQQLVADNKLKSTQSEERTRWLVGALALVVLILALAIWLLARRKQAVSLVPVPVGQAVEQWQERAMIAEQQTEKLQTAARAGLLAHLSQWLSRALTHRLISQRRLLLDTQNKAIAEMAELDERLEKVHAPLQDRLEAYEHRIAELEKELAARGAENRELLKTKIEMMRKQLEAQRDKNRVEFN